ncbi:MAG: stressosome-associated protein Prli42 [Clostridiales bacterium]|jgi:hypothetical protein|nr:stressosome-associated protein Prli42 [Clostridiales bacterium]
MMSKKAIKVVVYLIIGVMVATTVTCAVAYL